MVFIIEEIMNVYDEIAAGYLNIRSRFWDIIMELDVRHGWIGDIGCGPCHNGLRLAMDCRANVLCIDLSFNMLRYSRILLNKMKSAELDIRSHLIQGDMRFLPIRSSSLSALLYIASVNHIPPEYLDQTFNECYRVLRPSGKVLITLWALTHPTVLKALLYKAFKMLLKPSELKLRRFLDIYVPWRRKGRTYYRYYHIYRRKEVASALSKLGFKVIKVGVYNPHRRLFPENYYLILAK